MNDEQLLRYSRHILLGDFDLSGQESLMRARVLIVGAGGLGCPAAMYLAASGVGYIAIADDDVVDVSNLQRQVGHNTDDIGTPKVLSLSETLRRINPEILIEPILERLQGENLRKKISQVDVVLDCSDNFSTRVAINHVCAELKKPLVSGAAIRAEGQIAVFNLHKDSPCYVCLYGENPADENLTCSNSGVLAPLVGVIGSMQALEAIKIIASYGQALDGRLVLLDARSMEWRTLTLKKDPECPVCSH